MHDLAGQGHSMKGDQGDTNNIVGVWGTSRANGDNGIEKLSDEVATPGEAPAVSYLDAEGMKGVPATDAAAMVIIPLRLFGQAVDCDEPPAPLTLKLKPETWASCLQRLICMSPCSA